MLMSREPNALLTPNRPNGRLASGDENYGKGDTKMVLKMRVACYVYCHNAVPVSAYLLY